MNKNDLPELLTVSQTAEFLNVAILTLKRWEDKGYMNPVRIGPRRDRRYYRDDILKIYRGEK